MPKTERDGSGIFFPVFTGFRFTKGCVLKYKKYDRLGLQ
jgi:hypothetical protein